MDPGAGGRDRCRRQEAGTGAELLVKMCRYLWWLQVEVAGAQARARIVEEGGGGWQLHPAPSLPAKALQGQHSLAGAPLQEEQAKEQGQGQGQTPPH